MMDEETNITDEVEAPPAEDCEDCQGAGETLHRGYGGDSVNDYAKTCTACKGTGRA
jgi:DnaJ-class molecular chaperone